MSRRPPYQIARRARSALSRPFRCSLPPIALAIAAQLDDPNWHPSEAECRTAEAAAQAPAESRQRCLALGTPGQAKL